MVMVMSMVMIMSMVMAIMVRRCGCEEATGQDEAYKRRTEFVELSKCHRFNFNDTKKVFREMVTIRKSE